MPPGQLPPHTQHYHQPPGQYPPSPGWLPGQPYFPYTSAPPPPPKKSAWEKVGVITGSILLLVPFIILLTLFLLLVFVGKPYIVRGESMQPTLNDGDRVFVVPFRGEATPSRDDVVVLRDVQGSQEMLIKRVVAVGGDTVSVQNGSVVVNNQFVHKSTNRFISRPYSVIVPAGSIFVMGDNEGNSFDSRSFGPVGLDKVVGRAVAIFWPPSDFKSL